jgi:hypothetical protein
MHVYVCVCELVRKRLGERVCVRVREREREREREKETRGQHMAPFIIGTTYEASDEEPT